VSEAVEESSDRVAPVHRHEPKDVLVGKILVISDDRLVVSAGRRSEGTRPDVRLTSPGLPLETGMDSAHSSG